MPSDRMYEGAENNLRQAIDYLVNTIGSQRDMNSEGERDQVLDLGEKLTKTVESLEALQKARGRRL